MPWSTPFPKPVMVQDVEIKTLDDARKLMRHLPKDIRARDAWTNAADVLKNAAADDEAIGSAMAAVWLAVQLTPELRNAT
jgi:hypothetical protein